MSARKLRQIFDALLLLSVAATITGCDSQQTATTGQALTAAPNPAPVSTTTPPAPPKPEPTPVATATPSPRPSNAGDIRICAGPTTLNGVDVSDRNGARTWPTIGQSQSFAYIKATEGTTFTSDDYSVDFPAAAANGIVRGAYHYFHPGDDPTMQADYFAAAVGNFLETDLPPMLDWEVTDGVTATKDVANAITWLQRVQAISGKTPVIYTSATFVNALGNPPELVNYPLFVANYYETCPSVPPPWSAWVLWQTTPKGVVGGIVGNVDADLFNGSPNALDIFARTGVY